MNTRATIFGASPTQSGPDASEDGGTNAPVQVYAAGGVSIPSATGGRPRDSGGYGDGARPRLVACAGVVVVLLVLAGLAGCRDTRPGSFMSDVALVVQTALGRRTDVVTVRVGFQDDLVAAGRADVNVTAVAGAAFSPVVDDAVRLLWQSQLDPLSSIRVDLVDDLDWHRGMVRHVDAVREMAELEGRYGHRPPHPADGTGPGRIRRVCSPSTRGKASASIASRRRLNGKAKSPIGGGMPVRIEAGPDAPIWLYAPAARRGASVTSVTGVRLRGSGGFGGGAR